MGLGVCAARWDVERSAGVTAILPASKSSTWTTWSGCMSRSPPALEWQGRGYAQHPALPTYVVHDESLPLPKDEPGRVGVELDGEVGAGGVELLGTAAADILPQDSSGELVPIVNGEDVAVGEVQAGKESLVREHLGQGAQARRDGAGLKRGEPLPWHLQRGEPASLPVPVAILVPSPSPGSPGQRRPVPSRSAVLLFRRQPRNSARLHPPR